jgi:hypothetical protein
MARFCFLALFAVQTAGMNLGSAAIERVKQIVMQTEAFKSNVNMALPVMCKGTEDFAACRGYVNDALFCLELNQRSHKMRNIVGVQAAQEHCKSIDQSMPNLSLLSKILAVPGKHKRQTAFLQQMSRIETWARSDVHMTAQKKQAAPEDELAKEMTHDLEMNFNKIAPFGKEDTAKELQDHAAKTQDTLVDAVENAEVAEIKRAVFRALTRLRAATIKEFDTIARLETQAIDAYNDAHHYRAENPLAHLHEDEAPVETDKLKSFH